MSRVRRIPLLVCLTLALHAAPPWRNARCKAICNRK